MCYSMLSDVSSNPNQIWKYRIYDSETYWQILNVYRTRVFGEDSWKILKISSLTDGIRASTGPLDVWLPTRVYDVAEDTLNTGSYWMKKNKKFIWANCILLFTILLCAVVRHSLRRNIRGGTNSRYIKINIKYKCKISVGHK